MRLGPGLPRTGSPRRWEHAQGVKAASEVVPTPTDHTVLIDYAHTRTPWRTSLTTGAGFYGGTGDLSLRLRGDRDRAKRPKMGSGGLGPGGSGGR